MTVRLKKEARDWLNERGGAGLARQELEALWDQHLRRKCHIAVGIRAVERVMKHLADADQVDTDTKEAFEALQELGVAEVCQENGASDPILRSGDLSHHFQELADFFCQPGHEWQKCAATRACVYLAKAIGASKSKTLIDSLQIQVGDAWAFIDGGAKGRRRMNESFEWDRAWLEDLGFPETVPQEFFDRPLWPE